MHFEFLVEGQTELTALSILLPKIISAYGFAHTWKIHKHRGIGRILDNPEAPPNKHDPTLLHNLPSKLRAYGMAERDDVVVIVLVDLDDRASCVDFKNSLAHLLSYCEKQPKVFFRIAIEELEAWFLGDTNAINQAYPSAKQQVLSGYIQDSQCGTWEKLADAIYPGGFAALQHFGKRSLQILEQKRIWAKDICPFMDVQHNNSPSFRTFRDCLK